MDTWMCFRIFTNMNLASWAFGKNGRAEFKVISAAKHPGYDDYYVGQIHELGGSMEQQRESRSYRKQPNNNPSKIGI